MAPIALRQRFRLTVAFLGLFIAALALVWAGVASVTRSNAEARKSLSGAAQLIAATWSLNRDRLLDRAATTAQFSEIRDLLSGDDPTPDRIRDAERILRELALSLPTADTQIYSADYELLTRAAAGSASNIAAIAQWLRQIRSESAWTRLPGGELVFAFPVVGLNLQAQRGVLGYSVLVEKPRVLEALQQNYLIQRQIRSSLSLSGRTIGLTQAGMGEEEGGLLGRRLQHEQALDGGIELRTSIWVDYPADFRIETAWLLLLMLFLAALGFWMTWRFEAWVLIPLQNLGDTIAGAARGDVNASITLTATKEFNQAEQALSKLLTQVNASATRVSELAYRDTLTGLPNRVLFWQLLETAVGLARRYGHKCALMFVDLDDFKRVNDSLGHNAGDQLLTTVARRLEKVVRSTDIVSSGNIEMAGNVSAVGRLGGDEFLILLNKIEMAEDAAVVARRLIESLREEIMIQQQPLFIGASVGISVFPDDSGDAHALLRNADVAMYQAKSRGKNNFQYFAPGMNVSTSEQLKIQTHLRKAIQDGGLLLYLQPLFDTETGALVSAEALLRWKDPELGYVSPGVFIPIAESTGDIVPLTIWLIEEVCRRLNEWSGRLPPQFRIAFNVSSVDIKRPELMETLRSTIKKHAVPPSRLTMELTETGLMTGGEGPVRMLQEIRDMGLDVALDDFGTGYSSLSYLKNFPLTDIKIDKSFITTLAAEGENMAIVKAIISLGHSLHLKITAEGIETREQLQLLRALGCNKVQGFHFSQPIPADRFIQDLGRNPLMHRWADRWIQTPPLAETAP